MSFLAPKPSPGGRHVVLYDGECGLCDGAVQFLLKKDRARVLHYAPLQGSTAAVLRRRLRVPDEIDSLLFVRDAGTARETLLVRSSGVLAILDVLGGPWRVLSWLRVVPRLLRDAVYAFIAKRRTVWFGRLDACRVPELAARERFLD
ncbi:MAG: DCC1-like thiol-disulfide oxidoreductase family protein [Acidobacteriota bacterium]|nr:DCC1-like thiol-disulfide oxidoreductase family protein [Acidobacteriota bacterium]MDH3524912.1 DCC1-like thiol-disulfide oxidoreductase family protein [Acidobacteriota bacterium]